jgi:hypothetical protein
MPRCEFATVRWAAHIVHEILGELGITGVAQDLGRPRPARLRRDRAAVGFAEVRRAAHAFAQGGRAPGAE